LGSEVSRELSIIDEQLDMFIETRLKKKIAKQEKGDLYSHICHEGPTPPRLLSAINYEK